MWVPVEARLEQRDAELAGVLAKRFEDAVAARDLDGIGEVFTDDLVYEHPALPGPLRGRPALLDYWRDLFAVLPDLAFRQPIVFRAFADPRVVGTFYVFEATFEGGVLPGGFAPGGRRIRVHGMSLMELRHGKVARLRVFTDMTKFEHEIDAVGSGSAAREGE